MNKPLALALSLALAPGLLIGNAQAATIVPVNMDPAGQGLNDPTPAAPVGGNPGTTVGEQRRIAYQFAADLWGAILESGPPVNVQASFQPLSCTATSGVLGSAGATTVHRDFEGALLPATWYGGALANALFGEDLDPATNEINSRFNANLGSPGCLEASGWYYGLDGNTPSGRINFLDVVMHEIGHGLGFQGFTSLASGAPFLGFPDVYGTNVRDNASGQAWNALSNAGRAAAVVGGQLVWTGANVTDQAPVALGPLVNLIASGTLSANYEYGTAQFGPAATPANFSGNVVLANDGSATPTFSCQASPAGAYAGQVAIVDRGGCAFEIKVRFAQDAGATAVIVANNAAGVIGMAGDASVEATIPSLMVSQADGNAIKGALPGVSVALGEVPGRLAGADAAGRARLYAPAALATGSSFSHYDVSHSPNALMEPAISADLDSNLRLDLTPALYQDEGWPTNTGNAFMGSCDTFVPVLQEGGLVVGANVQAQNNVCLNYSDSKGEYVQCMTDYRNRLQEQGLLERRFSGRIVSCAARTRF